MSLLTFFYYKILLNQVVLSFFSGIMGALIAGGFSWWATKQAHEHNRKLKEDELYLYEKSTALSIIEELKGLKESYEKEFDEQYEALENMPYLYSYYKITQDYTTVYLQNAGKLGLIKNEVLRRLIINSYTKIKKYMEYLILYKEAIEGHEKKQKVFLAQVYPNLVMDSNSIINSEEEISIIRDWACKNIWLWLHNPCITQAQATNFLNSDLASANHLKELSLELREMYFDTKNTMNKTIELAQKEYSGENK